MLYVRREFEVVLVDVFMRYNCGTGFDCILTSEIRTPAVGGWIVVASGLGFVMGASEG